MRKITLEFKKYPGLLWQHLLPEIQTAPLKCRCYTKNEGEIFRQGFQNNDPCKKPTLSVRSLGQALTFLLTSVSRHRSRIREFGMMVNTTLFLRLFLRCLDSTVSRRLLSIYSSAEEIRGFHLTAGVFSSAPFCVLSALHRTDYTLV